MPLTSIRPGRSLTSYAKVRALVGCLLRNRRFQLRRPRVRRLAYLDLGCGPNTHDHCINLDFLWHPQVDLCWDVRRGLPFADGTMRGVFTEHCLEHFDLPVALALMRESRRILAPNGTLRIVVPDGELYLRTYVGRLAGHTDLPFPYETTERAHPLWTPMLSVNRVFYQDRESPFGHRMIYDFALLAALLRQAGFIRVERSEFDRSRDDQLRLDTPGRRCESLYVEASAPPP